MKLFSKGLAIFGLATIVTVSCSMTVQAASLFDLFGSNSQGNDESQTQSADTSKEPWFKSFGRNPRPAPEPQPSPQPSPQPQPTQPSPDDSDKDGLTAAQETEQKTDDTKADTDGDGLSDLIESRYFADRDAVFCHAACAYPNPVQKDLYFELDWMTRPNGSSTQPTPGQLGMVINAFKKEGITMHVDTGPYGGGNAVPYNPEIWFGATAGEADFVDYKRGGDGIAAQFDAKRNAIWHYMIAGERYKRIEDGQVKTDSSGVANSSGPNVFIAAATIPGNRVDAVMAGTIMHEIGHNLCLTGRDLGPGNPCSFPGIDNHDSKAAHYPHKDYRSSMNYLYQFEVVDYSHNPANSPTDHDDWAAIRLDVFPKYSENANGQTQDTAQQRKYENNVLSNLQHIVSANIAL